MLKYQLILLILILCSGCRSINHIDPKYDVYYDVKSISIIADVVFIDDGLADDVVNLPLSKELSEYALKTFRHNLEIRNYKIKEVFPPSSGLFLIDSLYSVIPFEEWKNGETEKQRPPFIRAVYDPIIMNYIDRIISFQNSGAIARSASSGDYILIYRIKITEVGVGKQLLQDLTTRLITAGYYSYYERSSMISDYFLINAETGEIVLTESYDYYEGSPKTNVRSSCKEFIINIPKKENPPM